MRLAVVPLNKKAFNPASVIYCQSGMSGASHPRCFLRGAVPVHASMGTGVLPPCSGTVLWNVSRLSPFPVSPQAPQSHSSLFTPHPAPTITHKISSLGHKSHNSDWKKKQFNPTLQSHCFLI